MRILFRRVLCALLCLCLMAPCLAAAEGDASGMAFDLQFQMDPSAFPAEQQKVLAGIADMVNIITLQGTLDKAYTGCFDLNAQLMLSGQEDTRTSLRLFGNESLWNVQSSLLGSETLMVNMIATLEFAMKIYFHMNIPLQRVALFVSPYVHTSAFEALGSAWHSVMDLHEGQGAIPREDLLALAGELSAIAQDDRTFQMWVQAVALEAGYDETLMDFMASLPDWADTFLAEEGITVSAMGATETWRTGETTLFTRTAGDDLNAWSLTLPTTLEGYDVSVFCREGELLQVHITDEYEDVILDLCVKAETVANTAFSLDVDIAGVFLEEDMQLRLVGQRDGDYFTLSMLNPQTSQPQLTVSGTVTAYTPKTIPSFTAAQLLEGVNLLSINDETLSLLLGSVGSPLVKGVFPLLVHMPASSVQSLLDLATESGLLDVLLNGGATIDEEFYD